MRPRYADVVFPPATSRSFTYRIPASWQDHPGVGHWVLAPFGPRFKPGLIVSLADHATQVRVPPGRIRDLHARLAASSPWTPDPRLIVLAQWMAGYYLAPVGACLALIQPPHAPFRSATRWLITPLGQQRLDTMPTGRTGAARDLLTALSRRPKGLASSTIDHILPNPSATLQRLTRQRWIREQQDWTERPFHPDPDPAPDPPTPRRATSDAPAPAFGTADNHAAQPSWWDHFCRRLRAGQFSEILAGDARHDRVALLANVIRETAARRRTTLVITPNINLAAQLAAQLGHVATRSTGAFHSGLSETQRRQQWQAAKQGRHAVVVGTRSALFLPLPALGCVWVDHEDDGAYKEEAGPHYHARDVARQRASLDNAVLVLHSPHPTLETIARHAAGRESARALPAQPRRAATDVRLINLQETAFGTIFSDALLAGIERALEHGGGAVVYHNRKGYAASLTCRDCGTAPQCPRCQVPCSFRQSHLLCAYCGRREPPPVTCPACAGTRLEPFGFGTERLEADLRRLYPHVAVGRYDGSAIRSDAAARRVRTQFAGGDVPILVGTQMLFHAAPLEPVRYLGVPYADAGLHMPDFRAAERVFHHLQQAMALLTPGTAARAVIQTRLPSHHVLQAVSRQRAALFYDQELIFRERMGYPPFGHLIQLHVVGSDAAASGEAANTWRRHLIEELTGMIERGETEQPRHEAILGPMAAHGPGPRGQRRHHLLVKGTDGMACRTLVRRTLERMTHAPIARRVRCSVNVDPADVW